MIKTIESGEWLLTSVANGPEPAWLQERREAAVRHFREHGLPTTFHEEWKYTNVDRFRDLHPTMADANDSIDTPSLYFDEGDAAASIVVVNGRVHLKSGDRSRLPDGVTISTLADAIESGNVVAASKLTRIADTAAYPFGALNSACMVDAVIVHFAPNTVCESTIHVQHIATESGSANIHYPRLLIVLESGAQASVVESYFGPDSTGYAVAAVTEIVLDNGAILDHVRVNVEGKQACHFGLQVTRHERDSILRSFSAVLGGSLVRNDIVSILDAEHVESTINGLYVTRDRQNVDNHTIIDHRKPNCNSWEIYKGVMADKSTAVFNGKIFVRQDAQKTDSKQTNQNLLLSRDATINTKPQLEIYADDVRCTHGATVGQLDEEAIFYLRSRGIPEAGARHMLVEAFAGDLMQNIKDGAVRERLEIELQTRMAELD